MCGRFAVKEDPQRLADYFHAAGGALDFKPSFNIAPSSNIISITADAYEHRHLQLMHWGLIPYWAKDADIGYKLINARGETIAEKPAFRSAFKFRRCLIPVSGFYEWKAEGRQKYPWYVSLKSGEPMAIAGLWETWSPKDGEVIESCSIITTGANELMAPIHDRMPVILDPDQWETWLSPNEKRADHLQPMIHPHESESMQAWPVTQDLNKVGRRDDAGLVEPVNKRL